MANEQKMFYRHVVKGTIFNHNPVAFGSNPLLELVTEEVAFPERHIPKGTKKRKARVNLETKEIPDEPVAKAKAGLQTEASKGL